MLEAVAERDADAAAALLAPEMRFEGTGRIGDGGRDEAIARLRQLADEVSRVRTRDVELRCDGETGRVTGTARVRLAARGWTKEWRVAADLRFEDGEGGFLLHEAKLTAR